MFIPAMAIVIPTTLAKRKYSVDDIAVFVLGDYVRVKPETGLGGPTVFAHHARSRRRSHPGAVAFIRHDSVPYPEPKEAWVVIRQVDFRW